MNEQSGQRVSNQPVPEQCKFCGAGVRDSWAMWTTYECATEYYPKSNRWTNQNSRCKDEQIKNLTAERDALVRMGVRSEVSIHNYQT